MQRRLRCGPVFAFLFPQATQHDFLRASLGQCGSFQARTKTLDGWDSACCGPRRSSTCRSTHGGVVACPINRTGRCFVASWMASISLVELAASVPWDPAVLRRVCGTTGPSNSATGRSCRSTSAIMTRCTECRDLMDILDLIGRTLASVRAGDTRCPFVLSAGAQRRSRSMRAPSTPRPCGGYAQGKQGCTPGIPQRQQPKARR